VTRLLHAEVLKLLTTRLLLWLALLVIALEVLVIALHVGHDSLESLASAGNQRDAVSIAAVSVLISLILGIVASAGEYTHGTINHTLLVAPVRERVAASKLAAAAIAGAFLALVSFACAWAFAALLLAARSVPLHLFTQATLRLLLGTIVAAAIAGALGVGFGLLLRRQTAAIVVALVWLLVGEPLLGIAGAERYGPGHAIASVVEAGDQGSDLLGFGRGLTVALLYAVFAGTLGTIAMKRSDVN
jgi:ABC-2 type transport system permease protein